MTSVLPGIRQGVEQGIPRDAGHASGQRPGQGAGQEIDEETGDDSGDPAAYRAALDSAIRSLSQREHARRELEGKLRRKGHAPALVDRVLETLVTENLLSDARFAEEYVRSRIRRGYGPIKIRQELSGRGIEEAELESQLTEPAEFWIEVARGSLAKKYGEPPTDRDDWNRQARFLARRGFPSDLIYRVLGNSWD